MNRTETIQTNRHILDEMMADLCLHQDPKFLKIEYSRLIDASKTNQVGIEKYRQSFSNLRYAWKKTLKYKNYFEYFYPQSGQIDKIEALNHHIHAYLEDMETLKNKIEVLFGEMKNDIKKVASNKKDIDEFFKAGIEKTKEVFAQVSKNRGEHRHRGMRFFDSDLLKAENAHRFLEEIITTPQFDAMLNQEYKPQLIEKFTKEREESFEIAKKCWIEMAKGNDEQTTGYLDAVLKGARSPLYQFLNIKPVQEIINSAEKQKK
ncbi:MAG: hypothetical protein AAB614_03350 [Patescibacteria group bacterium]